MGGRGVAEFVQLVLVGGGGCSRVCTTSVSGGRGVAVFVQLVLVGGRGVAEFVQSVLVGGV